jgi:hypothetical protein
MSSDPLPLNTAGLATGPTVIGKPDAGLGLVVEMTAAQVRTFIDSLTSVEIAAAYQVILVSGTNLKTINSTSLLGAGDIAVAASPGGSSGQIQYNNAGAFGGTTAIVYAASGGHLTVTAQSATDIPITARAAASQTTPVIRHVDSGGNLRTHISAQAKGSADVVGSICNGTLVACIGWYSSDWLVLSGGNGTLVYHAIVFGPSFASRLLTTGAYQIGDVASAPATPAAGTGIIYLESGSLKFKGSSGTVTVLGAP